MTTPRNAPPPRHEDARVARIVDFFEGLAAADVAQLTEIYAHGVRFKDPFHELVGVAAVQRVFDRMFEALDEPRFIVHDIVAERDQCVLTWDFVFGHKRLGRQTVRGCSHLLLVADGRIVVHRDYWDAAEELYEKLPFVGALMRWLRRRVSA